MASDPLELLVEELQAAQSAATVVVGEAPVGLRAVELGPDRRWYVCAFPGPRFAWVTSAGELEPDRARRHQVAVGALMVELAESLIDPAELQVVGAVARRLIGQIDEAAVDDALRSLDHATEALSTWRGAPARAIASVPALDVAVRLHDLARRAYDEFVTATDPLVERQDELAGAVVESLRELEAAASQAGLGGSLAASIAEAIEATTAGADEMVEAAVR